jgi:hypothetical protein
MSQAAVQNRFYRYRLRFQIGYAGALGCLHEASKGVVLRSGKSPLTIRAVDADLIGKANKFEISQGGFATPNEAERSAKLLRVSLLTTGAALGSGLNVSIGESVTHEKTEEFNKFDYDDRPSEKSVQRVGSKADILIIEQPEHDTDYINFEGGGLGVLNPASVEGLFNASERVSTQCAKFSSHQIMVVELFNAAYFENSLSARFLTWMLTIEAVLKLKPRPQRVVSIVKGLEEILSTARRELSQNKDMTNEECTSLQGLATTLEYAHSESISQGMARLAKEVVGDKEICGRIAEKFMKRCYSVRSSIVHTGTVGKYADEFPTLVEGFEELARKIVFSYLPIDSVYIPQSEMAQPNLNWTLSFS